MRVWILKAGRENGPTDTWEQTLGVYFHKEIAIEAGMDESPMIADEYILDEETNTDLYSKYVTKNKYYFVVDSWEVL